MQRFRDLVHTRRSWLVVSSPTTLISNTTTAPSTAPSTAVPLPGVSQEYRQQFTSLRDAISSSRPGDTILLEPGIHEASNLVISHPLQIIGDASTATASTCTIRCCTSTTTAALPVLHFAATAGKVSNIAIEGGIGGCIAHYKGRLLIEECSLRCDARGLQHLAAPLVSFACTGARRTSTNDNNEELKGGLEVGRAVNQDLESIKEDQEKEEEAAVKISDVPPLLPCSILSSRSCADHDIIPIGPGVVSVAGCCMQGGSTAVQLNGTGAVQSVRVIYESHKALFWFDVDSAAVGQEQEEEEEEDDEPSSSSLATTTAASFAEKEERDKTLISPSWVVNKGTIRFDPKALQAQIAAQIVTNTS